MMEGINNNYNKITETLQPSSEDISREFVRQYYTMLSERPHDVFRFYSHESFFKFDTNPIIQGQQTIQKEIEHLGLENCSARIHSVSAMSTIGNSIILQVCGELSLNEEGVRRFVQVFVLYPQTPKKYYVHNNLFQWLDKAFHDQNTSNLNGNNLPANVHKHEIEGNLTMSNDSVVAKEVNETLMSSEILADNLLKQTDHLKISDNDSVDDNGQSKTWAKLAGNNALPPTQHKNKDVSEMHVSPFTQLLLQPNVSLTLNGNNNSENHSNSFNPYSGHNRTAEDGCRIYIGGISKNLSPSSVGSVERDMKTALEKYGEVASVNVPRRALDVDPSSKGVYAFVIMKNIQAAKNVFSSAKKDERGVLCIPLKIDSLGFDGDALLSEQKAGQKRSFVYRGGMQGIPRNTYHMRRGMNGIRNNVPLNRGRNYYVDEGYRHPNSNFSQQ